MALARSPSIALAKTPSAVRSVDSAGSRSHILQKTAVVMAATITRNKPTAPISYYDGNRCILRLKLRGNTNKPARPYAEVSAAPLFCQP